MESPGSARVSRVGFGVSPKQSLGKSVKARAFTNTRDACATRNDCAALFHQIRAFSEIVCAKHQNRDAFPKAYPISMSKVTTHITATSLNRINNHFPRS